MISSGIAPRCYCSTLWPWYLLLVLRVHLEIYLFWFPDDVCWWFCPWHVFVKDWYKIRLKDQQYQHVLAVLLLYTRVTPGKKNNVSDFVYVFNMFVAVYVTCFWFQYLHGLVRLEFVKSQPEVIPQLNYVGDPVRLMGLYKWINTWHDDVSRLGLVVILRRSAGRRKDAGSSLHFKPIIHQIIHQHSGPLRLSSLTPASSRTAPISSPRSSFDLGKPTGTA